MFSASFLRFSSIAVGILLLLPALASFTVGGPGPCRRFCWFYDLTGRLISMDAANVLSGSIWLALAVAFVVMGVRMGNRQGRKRAA